MSYTIRSRFSTASSPVFTGGDRLVGRMAGQQGGNPNPGGNNAGGQPAFDPGITEPGGGNNQQPVNTGASGPQRTTSPALTLTPQQVQAIQMHPLLQPLVSQLVAGEAAGTIRLYTPNDTAPTDIGQPAPTPVSGNLGPSGPADVQPAPGATGGGTAPSLDAGLTDTAPVDYATQTATGPAGVSGDTGPQGPATGTSGLFGTDIPTPEPTPTYSGDSVLDPGLYAPPLDAIDYTNSNLTAT